MGPMSLKNLRGRSDYAQVDDVYYFARTAQLRRSDLIKSGLTKLPIVKTLHETMFSRKLRAIEVESALIAVQLAYKNFREKEQREPEWIGQLPMPVVSSLREQYLIVNENFDPFALFPTLPLTGFGYNVSDYGLTARISWAFGLGRLQGIRQLGFLHQPILKGEEPYVVTLPFQHTRFAHVNDVRAVAKIILANNNASHREHLRSDLAALTHDTLTPAGGDSTKGIDPQRFDEDKHYPELLPKINWQELPEYGPEDIQLLPDIIMNRGKLGNVLDIADKIAYLSRDVQNYLAPGLEMYSHKQVRRIIKHDPLVLSVWETVCVDGDKVFFTDIDRMIQFLELRCLMFRCLYQNPRSRFWEQFVKTFLLERLYKTGQVTAEQLCQWQDWELERFINKSVGRMFLPGFIGHNKERREGFRTLAKAQARKDQLRSEGRTVCILEQSYTIKTGVHFLVQTKNGVLPLAEAKPTIVNHLTTLVHQPKPFNVFYLDIPHNELPQALQTWI
jgi:hypothetical protein